MKKIISLLMASIMVFATAACNSGGGETTGPSKNETTTNSSESKADTLDISAPGELPIVQESVTIRIMQPKNANVSDYEDNKMTKYIEEQTGVNLEWMLIPEKDAATKINLVLATLEDLPDVFLGNGMTADLVVDHAGQGTFIAVDEYVKNDAYWYKEVLEKEPQLDAMMKLPDGKQYSMPRIVKSRPNQTSARAWINHVWLENLDLEMPTTTEELYDVLKAFKEQDANGNGDPDDEIPFAGASVTGWQTSPEIFLLNSFLPYNRGNMYYVDDEGNVQASYDNEAFRDGMKYLNRLYTDGLFDGASFTYDEAQLRQIFADEEIARLGFVPGGGTFIFAPMDGERVREYSPLPPLEGPDGVRYSYYNPSDNYALNHWVITNVCENPRVAWKVADFLYSKEVSMRNRLGEPGVDFEIPEEGIEAVDGSQALYKPILQWGSVQNAHWNEQGPNYNDFDNSGVKEDNPYELQQYLWKAMEESYWPYIPDDKQVVNSRLFYTLDDSRELHDINATLVDYVRQSMAQFSTGVLDPNKDSDWNTYIDNIKGMRYERAVEIYDVRNKQFAADME